MTPNAILRTLTNAGGTITPVERDGVPKLTISCPRSIPRSITPELIEQHRAELLAILTLEQRLRRGMDMLRAMEASGQMDTPKYGQRLRLFEELAARYTALCDGLIQAEVAA